MTQTQETHVSPEKRDPAGAAGTGPRPEDAAPSVGQEEARAVAEAAREKTWSKPSFARELYLGRLRLDLIHPHPRTPADQGEKGEAFLERLRKYLETLDRRPIDRDSRIPDQCGKGLRDRGASGAKFPEEDGGPGRS